MEEANADEAARVAERIRRSVAEVLTLNGREVTPSVSVGVAVLDEGESTLDELLHEADMAMYEAKRSGEGPQLLNIGSDANAPLPHQRA